MRSIFIDFILRAQEFWAYEKKEDIGIKVKCQQDCNQIVFFKSKHFRKFINSLKNRTGKNYFNLNHCHVSMAGFTIDYFRGIKLSRTEKLL